MEYLEQFEGYEIRYTATREFDEMVLRGRFTNARRAHSSWAGNWSNLNELDCTWNNIRKSMLPKEYIKRGADVASKDVPATWDAGNKDVVILHNERDIIEMVLLDAEISMTAELRAELAMILF